MAINIERNILKEYVGYQDQIFAAFGGFNAIKFKNNDYKVEHLFKSLSDLIQNLNDNLFLVFTGIKRKANQIEKKKFSSLNNRKLTILDSINQISHEAYKIFKDQNSNLDDIGLLLNDSWNLKKKLSSSVSIDFIDNLYNYGISSGAIGGKLLGAGGGGFILFYVPRSNQKKFIQSMNSSLLVPFKFISHGSRKI